MHQQIVKWRSLSILINDKNLSNVKLVHQKFYTVEIIFPLVLLPLSSTLPAGYPG